VNHTTRSSYGYCSDGINLLLLDKHVSASASQNICPTSLVLGADFSSVTRDDNRRIPSCLIVLGHADHRVQIFLPELGRGESIWKWSRLLWHALRTNIWEYLLSF